MNETLYRDAQTILRRAICAVLPDAAVARALENRVFPGKIHLVAAGKAAWQMANTAYETLGSAITDGIVITKYHHARGPIGNFRIREAGHPIPDDNSFAATREALAMTENLTPSDTVLFLLSGGGSALFEDPQVPAQELQSLTARLLASGADIVEINTLRKRLSKVKGGRFAAHCAPAQVFTIVLSDILGDPLDMIASGPAYPDSSTCTQARKIAEKYDLSLSDQAKSCLDTETPKSLENVTTHITGSVTHLCRAAADAARDLGYEPLILTDSLTCQAREAGAFLASIARTQAGAGKKAFIAGGETVVKVTGTGKGGRNQELALSAALGLEGLQTACIFSFGSDGTDGPTDAAGGYADGDTARTLRARGLDPEEALSNNDAYHALQAAGTLLITGPTGTNVNDAAVILIGE